MIGSYNMFAFGIICFFLFYIFLGISNIILQNNNDSSDLGQLNEGQPSYTVDKVTEFTEEYIRQWLYEQQGKIKYGDSILVFTVVDEVINKMLNERKPALFQTLINKRESIIQMTIFDSDTKLVSHIHFVKCRKVSPDISSIMSEALRYEYKFSCIK